MSAGTKKQFGILKDLMNRSDVDIIVNACEAHLHIPMADFVVYVVVVRLGDLREKKETSSRKKVNAVVCFCIEIQWTTALIFDEQVPPCPTQRAKLDALLYNNPLEYAQLVLIGEIEHYLSLGCDHGRMED